MPNLNFPVSDELHRRVKSAAALAGLTLKDFAARALEAEAERVEEQARRARKAKPKGRK